MTTEDPPAQPLTDTRVLDFTQNLAGPFGSQILADLGADVIKVEPPTGDAARGWGPPFIGGQSPLFQVANRNKRSVVLNLKDEVDQRRALALAEESDVVLQAFRRGVPERLGIGYDQIRAVNPTVIYISVTAFGHEGPLRDDPGYDPLMQARSGLMDMTGDPDGDPARVGASVVDLGTGMWIGIGALGALLERQRTGEGSHVTASLLDTSLSWMSYHLTSFLATGDTPRRLGSSIAMIAPYEAFPTRDGKVMIAAGNDTIFGRLCESLDLEVTGEPDFSSNPARVANRVPLVEMLSEKTRRLTVSELLELLRQHGVPAAPIHSVEAAAEDPQTVASGMLRKSPHPETDDYVDVAMPIRWNGVRPPAVRHPPRLGEHQDEIFPESS